MPTQEERIVTLEQTTREYRPVLQNFAYELTMVKGLIIEQTGITQELRRDVENIDSHLGTIDTRLDRIETLLTQVLARLPKQQQ
jgi:seryl-tRNA synthetase